MRAKRIVRRCEIVELDGAQKVRDMPKKKVRRIRGGKPGDPLLIFINATAFQEVAKMIDTHPAKSMFLWPMVAIESFALEQYIKCLHRLRRRWPRKLHNVKDLFAGLSKADKNNIAARFLDIVRGHRDYLQFVVKFRVSFDVNDVLLRASDMFSKARYWYELELPSADSKGHSSNAGIGNLSDAIRDLILELRPEWKDEVQNFRFRLPQTGLLPT